MDEKELNGCNCCSKEHEHEHDCSCGCGTHEPIIVELEDEEGNSVKCEVVEGFAYKEQEYALVQNPNDESVYLFKVVGEGDEGELVVPDDEEFKEVTAYYENLLESEE